MYRLLIADDDKELCESVRNLIDWPAYGFSVVAAAGSYAEAVDQALDVNPHVALVDVKLGGQWGYELAEHLRSIGMKTVFCMLSEDNDPFVIRRSMQAGAQDFLLKPLSAGELQAFVEKVVAGQLNGKLPESSAGAQELDPVLHKSYASLSKITNKIILVVRSGYRAPQTLSSIAEGFHMNGKYIGRVFLKDTGMKFSEYLMAYRMQEARKLIVNTREKISVIAGMVGYQQLNSFYVHFKNYYGVSPGMVRSFQDAVEQAGNQERGEAL